MRVFHLLRTGSFFYTCNPVASTFRYMYRLLGPDILPPHLSSELRLGQKQKRRDSTDDREWEVDDKEVSPSQILSYRTAYNSNQGDEAG